MKTHLASVAAVALLSVTGASAMLHITNPDYVVIINHEFETPSGSNFGGGFSDSGGGVVLVDNGAFKYQNTTPIITSCTVGSDGICRLPGNLIIGNRWPGEVIYASDILGGVQGGSFSSLSRSSDSGIWQPLAPDSAPPSPQKCVADICDTAKTQQHLADANALSAAKGRWAAGKWVAGTVVGAIGSLGPLKMLGGAFLGGGAFYLTKEAGSDALDALAQNQIVAVNAAYSACKKKCGA